MKRNKIICLLLAILTLSALAPCAVSAEIDLSYQAAIAYWGIIDDLAAKYGYAEHSEDGAHFGYARLIDFDSDGYTELLVAYDYKFDVYGYYENGLTHLHSGSCWAVGGFFDLYECKKGYNTYLLTYDEGFCDTTFIYGTVENKKWAITALYEHTGCDGDNHTGKGNSYGPLFCVNDTAVSQEQFDTLKESFVRTDSDDSYTRYSKSGTEEARNTLIRIINAKKPIRVIVKEIEVAFDQTPVIVEDRTLVPIRAIVEAMGGKVSWDSKTATATLTLKKNTLKLTIGSQTATLNGKEMTMDVPPQIIGDRTMIPVRFAAENLNFCVKWDAETKTVIID